MAYLDTRNRPSPASMAAVVAIHGAIGAALIFGLTMKGVIAERDRIAVFTDPVPPPPPLPPEPQPEKKAQTPERKITVPVPPLPFPQPTSTIETTIEHFPPQPPLPSGGSETLELPRPTATPSFKPVGAIPRTDPGRWVSTEDYRSNWIRQEMAGKAKFRLEIAADGRVTDCTITGSSGYQALDQATCALVSRRAKFQPARGSEGQPVAGTYSNAIDWQLPE